VTVVGIAVGTGFLLLGVVQISAYFQHYQGADPGILAAGIPCVLLGAVVIAESLPARALVVTGDGMSGVRNLRPMVITWPSVSMPAGSPQGWLRTYGVTTPRGARSRRACRSHARGAASPSGSA
jgi:hypothetical protein